MNAIQYNFTLWLYFDHIRGPQCVSIRRTVVHLLGAAIGVVHNVIPYGRSVNDIPKVANSILQN
jgi:hypothetical protein